MALGGEVVQECCDLGFPDRRRMALAGKVDETLNSVDVGLLRAAAKIAPPDRLVHLVEQPRAGLPATGCRDGIR